MWFGCGGCAGVRALLIVAAFSRIAVKQVVETWTLILGTLLYPAVATAPACVRVEQTTTRAPTPILPLLVRVIHSILLYLIISLNVMILIP